MELSGWSIYFGSFVLFFLIGFTIISHFLFEDHEIKSKIPLFIFSVVFGFAMMMLQMVFFEIAGVGTQETRYLKWVVTICALTYTSLFILPTVLLLNILGKLKLRSKTKIFISVIFGLAYLWAISNMLLEEIRVNQPEKTEFAFIDWSNIFDMFDIFLPLTQVGVLASLGMTIIAVLSGYGAVNMPVLYYNLYDEKMLLINQSTFDMRMIETVENIAAKKKLNLQLLRQLKERGPGAPQKRWTRLVNWVTGKKGELEKHIEENEEELRILKKAHNELFMDYSQFLRDKEAYTKSKSLIGKLQYLVGRILSFYCLYRIVLSIYAIIIGRGRGLDPINRFIKITLRIMNHKLNDEIYEMISAQLAFIIIGILVFINVRSFVKCIIQFFKNFGRGLLSNVFFSELIVYILTEILAMYFISTFLLMYNNFPVQHRKNMEAFFGELNFRTLYRLFDTIFLVSALAAMALIWLNDKLKKEKYTRYLQRQGSDSSEFKMKKD